MSEAAPAVNTGKLNTMVALTVFMVMFFIYQLTVAPTISFWDSSEFITCAAIMGIPHPPGSPLLSLLSRVMMIIPFYDSRGSGFESIAYRINLLAVLSGALTVMLTYLITVKLITRITPFRGTVAHDGLIMFSALLSGLMAGFSHQFWENSVEIETYMPVLFISMLAVFFSLKWEDSLRCTRRVATQRNAAKKKDEPDSLRCNAVKTKNISPNSLYPQIDWGGYLLLAVYLIGLGMGIHLYVLLITPTVFLIVLSAKPSPNGLNRGWFSDVRLWVTLALIIIGIFLLKHFGKTELFIMIMVIISISGPFLFTRLLYKGMQTWKNTLFGMLLCLSLFAVGYSVYPTIMVRAFKKPAINEGNPDNWNRYSEYLNRSQYGQGNMYRGMFVRNASFDYQFHYLYLRYFLRQFPEWGPSPEITFTSDRSPDYPGRKVLIRNHAYLPVFLMLLLLFGIYFHIRNDIRRFGMFFLYFLVSSIGLVLYLNMENPQVRERGYFFLGSFQIIMVWIGIGVYGVISFVRNHLSTRLLTPVTAFMIAVFASLIPTALLSGHIDPDYTNYQVHDRSKNWIPYDYATNMLQSCGKNAVLFTHGDNDTYPLWYAQYVNGVRKDVRVVNLSILNAPWYIKQLRDEGETVPIVLSDDFIDNKLCASSLASYKTLLWTPEPKEVTLASLTWKIPPTYITGNGENGILSVSSYMVAHIIDKINWRRPVYFSTYVEPSKMIGLVQYMSMEGLVFHLTKEKSGSEDYYVSAPILRHNIFEKYRYRGITDPEVYKSPETVKLLHNYFIAFVDLFDRYMEMGDKDNALLSAQRAYEFSLQDTLRLEILRQALSERGLDEEINNIIRNN